MGCDSWRVIRDGPLPGARNMALDHALAESLGPDEGVLRLYGWERPTVSFGRNEPARELYSVAESGDSLDFVRRPTGGRAVLHDAELTYAVVVPLRAFGGVRAAYRRFNEGLVAGLSRLGVAAVVARGEAVLAPDAGPCFQAPAPGEVVAGGRKLVGSAQARVGRALLQHGSIIISGDQAALAHLTGEEADPSPPATLTDLVGEVSPEDVADAIAEGFRLAFGGSWNEGAYRYPEIAGADRLRTERYGQDAWTWRR